MKKGIFLLLILADISLSACQKETAVSPKSSAASNSKGIISATPALNNSAASNTSAPAIDTIKGYLRVQLSANAANTDNILIEFNPTASTAFVKNEDAGYLKGFSAVNLSSLSSNGIACAINVLPLTTPGSTIALNVNARSDGAYALNLLDIHTIPATYKVWLKDKYMKDSLDFRSDTSYAFNIAAKDTATYGSNRFSIVVHKK